MNGFPIETLATSKVLIICTYNLPNIENNEISKHVGISEFEKLPFLRGDFV
jgi:hypothetical protein